MEIVPHWGKVLVLVPMEIDPSEEDIITPERLAKGDLEVTKNMRGKINRAIPANLTIMKELIRRGVFPYHYEIYGLGLMELRLCFRAPWAPKSCAVLTEQWGVGISPGTAGEIYQNVCKALGKNRLGWVEYVVEQPKEKELKSLLEVWKECFELLCTVMDSERNRIVQQK